MTEFEELLEAYRKWSREEDDARMMQEEIKLLIAERRTEIAAQVLSAVNEKGDRTYRNELSRKTEIDRRCFADEKIAKLQEALFEAEKRERDARRERKAIEYMIEARIRSPRVV